MPRARLGLLPAAFLRTGRRPLLVTCATIASCGDFDDIVGRGENHLDLRRFAEFHHGIPGERWLGALVNRIDPMLFGRCFENWVAALWPGRHEFIAIDGRRRGAPATTARGSRPLHTLSAFRDLGKADAGAAERAGKDHGPSDPATH